MFDFGGSAWPAFSSKVIDWASPKCFGYFQVQFLSEEWSGKWGQLRPHDGDLWAGSYSQAMRFRPLLAQDSLSPQANSALSLGLLKIPQGGLCLMQSPLGCAPVAWLSELESAWKHLVWALCYRGRNWGLEEGRDLAKVTQWVRVLTQVCFFFTTLLRCDWHVKSCTYLMYTIWWIWGEVYTHETITTIKARDLSITSQNFFPFPLLLLVVCVCKCVY